MPKDIRLYFLRKDEEYVWASRFPREKAEKAPAAAAAPESTTTTHDKATAEKPAKRTRAESGTKMVIKASKPVEDSD
jgi:hypothetical protein